MTCSEVIYLDIEPPPLTAGARGKFSHPGVFQKSVATLNTKLSNVGKPRTQPTRLNPLLLAPPNVPPAADCLVSLLLPKRSRPERHV